MTDRQKVMIQEHKIGVLEADVSMLADVVRDGIELAWGDWMAWQTIARMTLAEASPDHFKELESLNKVRPIAKGLGIIGEHYDDEEVAR